MRRYGILTILASLIVVNVATAQSVVYSKDFESGAGPEWSMTNTDATPIGNRRFLGQFGNDTVALTLTGLPEHTEIVLSFDLFVILSWDGNNTNWGPDVWILMMDGNRTLINTTSTDFVASEQAYPGAYPDDVFPGQTGAEEIGTLGYSWDNNSLDATYRVTK